MIYCILALKIIDLVFITNTFFVLQFVRM